jgi:hypothetical protein
MVLRFRNSLYGLKQSSHVWYGTVMEFKISIGLVASCVDGGLVVLEDQGTVVAGVVLYVDDLLVIANKGLIGQINDQMKKRFRMHDLGSVSLYLGINIKHNRKHHTIDIHQHSHILPILAQFRTDESSPVATPMVMNIHKRKPTEEACDPIIYQSMIGSLIYAIAASRLDIAFAIGVLSRFDPDPSNEHMVPLKHVCPYLNGTKDWRLRSGGALAGALRGALAGALGGALGRALRRALGRALGGALGGAL